LEETRAIWGTEYQLPIRLESAIGPTNHFVLFLLNMAKAAQLSLEQRCCVALQETGLSFSLIAKQLNIFKSMVYKVRSKYQLSVTDRKATVADIHRYLKLEGNFLSISTVKRRLVSRGMFGRVAQRKPFL